MNYLEVFSLRLLNALCGVLLVASGGLCVVGDIPALRVPPGSKLFIAPMDGKLDGFIAPEIVKKKVPLIVVTDENDADYILTGTSIRADDKWYHVVFGGKDKNEGNVKLIDIKEKRMVWAGEAGDRSLWWGGFRRGGQRKVADRIVKQMKEDCFRNAK